MSTHPIDTPEVSAKTSTPDGDTPRGFALALTVYLLWGFLPLYLRLLTDIPPMEILAHRIIWSLPFAGAIVFAAGHQDQVKVALRHPKVLALSALCSIFISINWGVYIWAVSNAHTVDAALGYFINPLFSIALAAIILRERLTKGQLIAIALAVCAVLILMIETGRLPLVALALPLSWGSYALLKKTLPIGGNAGFTLEALILSVPSAAYIIYLEATGQGHFLDTPRHALLLIGCGAATAIPLMIYANAAKLLRLSTIGIMQYIAPSVIFLIAVFVFKEPLELPKLTAFALIWAALCVYTFSMLHTRRKTARAKR